MRKSFDEAGAISRVVTTRLQPLGESTPEYVGGAANAAGKRESTTINI